jgi:hypothetical protein
MFELQCGYIPADMRGLRNTALFVEGDLYIWVLLRSLGAESSER